MAFKRKICEDEIEGEAENKRAKNEENRLTNLPDDLKLHILSSLDTKDAFKTTLLSKTWVSSWSWIPVLDFNSYTIYNLHVFDKFVNKVLRVRNRSAKLDQLTFTRRGICSAKILKNVFGYAFSHRVKKLEAFIDNSRNHTWPVCLNSSFESLTSLKLQSSVTITCLFLGPRSGLFKNLTDLYLRRAIISDLDPFSGFRVLERLTLVNCDIRTDGKTLNVHALNLTKLTICSSYQNLDCCELTTPRLRFIEHRGCDFPVFRSHKGLPVLETMVTGFNTYGGCCHKHEKKMFDNLFALFCILDHNVKSLTLFRSTVEILYSFREELVKRSSPFRNLKCLKLDFSYDINGPLISSSKIVADVKAYLLQNSPDAEVTIYPNYSTN